MEQGALPESVMALGLAGREQSTAKSGSCSLWLSLVKGNGAGGLGW